MDNGLDICLQPLQLHTYMKPTYSTVDPAVLYVLSNITMDSHFICQVGGVSVSSNELLLALDANDLLMCLLHTSHVAG